MNQPARPGTRCSPCWTGTPSSSVVKAEGVFPRAKQLLGLGLGVALLACEGSRPSVETDAPLYSHDGRRYRVAIERVEGAADRLRAWVEPRGSWHLAPEFPFKLETTGHGIRAQRPLQTRAEALEISEERAEFGISLAAEGAGRAAGRLDGTFWFGICEEDLVCERIGHEFTFTVP